MGKMVPFTPANGTRIGFHFAFPKSFRHLWGRGGEDATEVDPPGRNWMKSMSMWNSGRANWLGFSSATFPVGVWQSQGSLDRRGRGLKVVINFWGTQSSKAKGVKMIFLVGARTREVAKWGIKPDHVKKGREKQEKKVKNWGIFVKLFKINSRIENCINFGLNNSKWVWNMWFSQH